VYFFKPFFLNLFILLVIVINIGCNKTNEIVNLVPTCIITSPSNNDEFNEGENINIAVNASDLDGNIVKVTYFVDDFEIGLVSMAPYDFIWVTTGTSLGGHTILALAEDNNGATASDEISILINEVPELIDFDGNEYNVVEIGNQWWMAENLKTTHYADGTEIPLADENLIWNILPDDYIAYTYANNNLSNEASLYGAQYTWAAAVNNTISTDNNPSEVNGVCPTGWHLPSDSEWMELEEYLGITNLDGLGPRGTNEGSQLAGSINLWTPGVLIDNASFGASGFNALPGGRRDKELYLSLNVSTNFWTATESDISTSIERIIIYNESGVVRVNNRSKKNGYYVRCVKDD